MITALPRRFAGPDFLANLQTKVKPCMTFSVELETMKVEYC